MRKNYRSLFFGTYFAYTTNAVCKQKEFNAVRLGIPVQALVINQCILPEVVEGNRFLEARAKLQARYLDEIERRFDGLVKTHFPLLDRDVSDLATLRQVGEMLYGE